MRDLPQESDHLKNVSFKRVLLCNGLVTYLQQHACHHVQDQDGNALDQSDLRESACVHISSRARTATAVLC